MGGSIPPGGSLATLHDPGGPRPRAPGRPPGRGPRRRAGAHRQARGRRGSPRRSAATCRWWSCSSRTPTTSSCASSRSRRWRTSSTTRRSSSSATAAATTSRPSASTRRPRPRSRTARSTHMDTCDQHRDVYDNHAGGFDYTKLPAGFICRPDGTTLTDKLESLGAPQIAQKIQDAQVGLGEGVSRSEIDRLERKLVKGDEARRPEARCGAPDLRRGGRVGEEGAPQGDGRAPPAGARRQGARDDRRGQGPRGQAAQRPAAQDRARDCAVALPRSGPRPS